MASVQKEILIEAGAEDVWAVIGDFAAGPSRMATGFVIDTRLEADARVVTFADGTVARERLVGLDDLARRIAYSVVGDAISHGNASMQVFGAAMDQGLSVVKQTSESQTARS
jgi:hypothetical protein